MRLSSHYDQVSSLVNLFRSCIGYLYPQANICAAHLAILLQKGMKYSDELGVGDGISAIYL